MGRLMKGEWISTRLCVGPIATNCRKRSQWNDSRFLALRPAWAAIESYVDLLTKIDSNRYGVVPDVGALSHPDAVVIGEAVRNLDGLALGVSDDWNSVPVVGDIGSISEYGAAALAKALAA